MGLFGPGKPTGSKEVRADVNGRTSRRGAAAAKAQRSVRGAKPARNVGAVNPEGTSRTVHLRSK